MNSKIKLISNYINKCEEVLKNNNEKELKDLEETIVQTFSNNIPKITSGLSCYNFYAKEIKYISDIQILKAKLENYKADLEFEIEKAKLSRKNTETSPTVNVNQNTNVNVNISFDQAINNIQKLPDTILSQDEKDSLMGKIRSLEKEKNKSKLWGKVQNILKWIADKSVEVGIAALPYIAQLLNK